ncbi:hypothetical protein [Gluconobacter oxydans]|uniref:Uncharacterized protein n=1 Tax=Gluconobacter oxydans NBRC 3293 TaxID=1315969 RepID=A0A829WL71_GLUOY|nr:hypothetical protein [Gluconobacter oxydans]GEM16015.1 hypothetical protein NBRC3293_0512 [Gluconobacter oxydans NBRC 3293]
MLPIVRHAARKILSFRKGGAAIFEKALDNEALFTKVLSEYEWREIKRLIRKRINIFQPGLSKQEINRRKKYAKKIIQSMRRTGHKKRSAPLSRRVLAIRKKKSILLEAFYPDREVTWQNVTKRSRTEHEVDLKDFSLIDYPEKTIKNLQDIARGESLWVWFKINFLDTACLDISPYLILGLMHKSMPLLSAGGKITPAVTGMIDAVGLAELLSIGHISRYEKEPIFHAFRVRHRRSTGSSTSHNIAAEPSSRESITDDLIDTVDQWLRGLVQKELNKDGKYHLSSIVGEILNNAERHSDLVKRDGDWAIAGFLSYVRDNKNPEKINTFCSLSIISLGATICDSISECEDFETKNSMNGYIEKHHRDAGVSKECLATIYALQDGVSRFQQDDTGDKSRGGVGMMDMIQFVGALGALGIEDEPPAITVLSGEACINIRLPHFSAILTNARENQPRQIWFNDSNDIAVAPDAAYVKSMPVRFPGTAVAIRFYISPNSEALSHGEGGV